MILDNKRLKCGLAINYCNYIYIGGDIYKYNVLIFKRLYKIWRLKDRQFPIE